VTPERLREQVGEFLRRGFEPLTFSQALGNGERKALAVTFDDAYRSVPELALPVLLELGVPATVFVPTGDMEEGALRVWPGIEQWVGSQSERELRGASWAELGALSDAGWEIGSHTRTHPHLTGLDEESLRRELRGSREDCVAATGLPCTSLAYPYGEADSRVAAAAAEAGYEAATTLGDHIPAPSGGRRDPMLWPRLGVYQQDRAARLRLKSEAFLRGRWAWNAAQSLRGASR
jgi:peptidoglycan/xylan/chitin deacetylase (PgdA/CDA1 family)